MFGIFKNLFNRSSSENLVKYISECAFFVDVRTTDEFSAGSVKGAVNIPLDKVHNQLSKFKDKKHIIVFCRSGTRSSQAKKILEKNGFTNVTNGGSWQNVNEFVTN